MKEKYKTEKPEKVTEENEEYLKYIMKDNTININVYEGGTVIFQSGKPKDEPRP